MPNIHASNSSKAGVQNTAATQGSATAMVSKLINYLLINISKQIHIFIYLLFSKKFIFRKKTEVLYDDFIQK